MDTFATLVFEVIIVSIVGSDGAAQAEIASRLNASLGLQLSMLVVGLSFTGIGGYVAARLAKQQQLRNAAYVGCLSLATSAGLSLLAEPSSSVTPLWLDALGYVLVVPAALLGGWFRTSAERKPA